MAEQQPKTLRGQLGRKQIGNRSMPVDAPYYQDPPFFYRDARSVTVVFETDADIAASVLPKPLDLLLPATANLVFVHYPYSTFGEYREAILQLNCLHKGMPLSYVVRIVVDSVPPLIAGRELWGYPKKLADISLEWQDNLLAGRVSRHGGKALLDVAMRPERPIDVDDSSVIGGVSLRVIPDPQEDAERASLCELIAVTQLARATHEAWIGPATVDFAGANLFEPWDLLPVKKILTAVYARSDFQMPHGEVLKTV